MKTYKPKNLTRQEALAMISELQYNLEKFQIHSSLTDNFDEHWSMFDQEDFTNIEDAVHDLFRIVNRMKNNLEK